MIITFDAQPQEIQQISELQKGLGTRTRSEALRQIVLNYHKYFFAANPSMDGTTNQQNTQPATANQ